MERVGRSQQRAFDRRRWPRVRLSVPVQLTRRKKGEAGAPGVCEMGHTTNVSAGGAYLKATEGLFARGDILTVSLTIPWEARRLFPFSLIQGSGRVVRIETEEEGNAIGLAVAFCGPDLTLLGAVATPR